jgi:hypothetical protein
MVGKKAALTPDIRATDKEYRQDPIFKDLLGEQSLLIGLNSFVAHEYAINILPDYESLGDSLSDAIKKFGAENVLVLPG